MWLGMNANDKASRLLESAALRFLRDRECVEKVGAGPSPDRKRVTQLSKLGLPLNEFVPVDAWIAKLERRA